MLLSKKLKIKNDIFMWLVNAPANYEEFFTDLDQVFQKSFRYQAGVNAIHWFVTSQAEIEKGFEEIKEYLETVQLFWVSFPKKSSEIKSTISRDNGWDLLLANNWAVATLISINDDWSAFQFKKSAYRSMSISRGDQDSPWFNKVKKLVNVPDDLKKILTENQCLEEFFDSLSYSNKKEYVLWIVGAKQEKTRLARLKSIKEKLVDKKKNPTEK